MKPLYLLIAALTLCSCSTQDSKVQVKTSDRSRTYAEAFNRHDVDTLMELWAEDGEYHNPDTGDVLYGKAAIRELYEVEFEQDPELRIEMKLDSIDNSDPDLAVEKGTSTVYASDAEPLTLHYAAIYVKEAEGWRLGSMSEVEQAEEPSSYEYLRDLEWMIGDWVDADEHIKITTSCRWVNGRNQIYRSYTFAIDEREVMSGFQVIAWDPILNKIRSWRFDSNAAYSEGVWEQDENRWIVQALTSYGNGIQERATHVLSLVDKDAYTWQSINRERDGELLPNSQEVTIIRSSMEVAQ